MSLGFLWTYSCHFLHGIKKESLHQRSTSELRKLQDEFSGTMNSRSSKSKEYLGSRRLGEFSILQLSQISMSMHWRATQRLYNWKLLMEWKLHQMMTTMPQVAQVLHRNTEEAKAVNLPFSKIRNQQHCVQCSLQSPQKPSFRRVCQSAAATLTRSLVRFT